MDLLGVDQFIFILKFLFEFSFVLELAYIFYSISPTRM